MQPFCLILFRPHSNESRAFYRTKSLARSSKRLKLGMPKEFFSMWLAKKFTLHFVTPFERSMNQGAT